MSTNMNNFKKQVNHQQVLQFFLANAVEMSVSGGALSIYCEEKADTGNGWSGDGLTFTVQEKWTMDGM